MFLKQAYLKQEQKQILHSLFISLYLHIKNIENTELVKGSYTV